MRIWKRGSIRFRAQVMKCSPYLLAIILGVCAALFLNGKQNFFGVQESQVEKSVVEKSSEASPGAKSQIENIPSEHVELAAKEFHETGTDSREIFREDSSKADPLAHEMTAQKNTELQRATIDPAFLEELSTILNEGGVSQSEIEDIFSELERIAPGIPIFSVSGVKDELLGLAKSDKNAKAALALLERVEMEHVEGPVDHALLGLASGTNIVCTNDKVLKDKIRRKGAPVIYLRQRQHLAIDGHI